MRHGNINEHIETLQKTCLVNGPPPGTRSKKKGNLGERHCYAPRDRNVMQTRDMSRQYVHG